MINKPHGIAVDFESQILGTNKISKSESNVEGFIKIKNLKTNEITTLPMRSFITNFLASVKGFFDGGTNPKRVCAVHSVSISGSMAGMLIGTGQNPVTLGDTNLANKIESASMTYGDSSFIFNGNDNNSLSYIQSSRVFTNLKTVTETVYEVGLMGKAITATAGGTYGNRLFARDMPGISSGMAIPGGTTSRFTIKLNLNQSANGYGGAINNFTKLINNFLLRGNINQQKFTNRVNNAETVTYSSYGATLGASTALQVNGGMNALYGIVVGTYEEQPSNPRVNPSITPGDTTFHIISSGLTYGAVTISAISYPYTNAARFSITRDIINSGIANIYIDRIGLINRGLPSNNGASLINNQCFYAINKPSEGSIILHPSQILRVTYYIGVQV